MRQRRINLRGLVSPLAIGLLWELLVALGVLNANYLPPPSQLAPHLVGAFGGRRAVAPSFDDVVSTVH